jgi:hypothetical protein
MAVAPGKTCGPAGVSRLGGFRGAAPPGRYRGLRRSRQLAASSIARLVPASSLDHRCARVYAPGSLVGKTLDFHALAVEKLFDGTSRLIWPDTGQDHVPVGRLKWEGCQ